VGHIMDRLTRKVELMCSAALAQCYPGLKFYFWPWWSQQGVLIRVRGSIELLVHHGFVLEQHLPLLSSSGLDRKIPGVYRIRKRGRYWEIELSPFCNGNRRLAARLQDELPEFQEELRRGHALVHAGCDPRRVQACVRPGPLVDREQQTDSREQCRRQLVWDVEGRYLTPRWVIRTGSSTADGDECGSAPNR
jgi:hypothetical protein